MTARMLLFTVFCCVSGGPFGLEAVVQQAGPGMAILLILVIPLLWAVPDALITAELSSAMPVEGGYYQWTKRAIGPGVAFLNGWWTWIYGIIDTALYPIYFAETLALIVRQVIGEASWTEGVPFKWGVALTVIAVFTLLNIRGTRVVGATSVVLTLLVVAPFAVMALVAGWRYVQAPGAIITSFLPAETSFRAALQGGLGLAIWNYLGWDSLSTIAEEVEEPERAYPRAMIWGIPLITGVYLVAVLSGLPFVRDLAQWEDGAWPAIAAAVGGPALFWMMSLAGLASSAALFTATFLGASRIPFVMAEDRLMPKALTAIHCRFGTPWISILVCAAIYAFLSRFFSFQDLIAVNIVLYAVAQVTEGISLLIFRVREPGLVRPFRIPGGFGVALVLVALPALLIGSVVVLSILEEGWARQLPTAIALASGPVLWAIIQFRRQSKARSDAPEDRPVR